MKKILLQTTLILSIIYVFILSACAPSAPKINKYTVTFKDYDETILRQEIIEQGHNATAPADPVRYGYIFIGWDNDYKNIQKDTILVAQYERDLSVTFEYKVIFKDYDGTILKEEIVQEGENATAPTNPIRTGYNFLGWDKEYLNIKNDLIVSPKYETIKYTISYELNDGILKNENQLSYTIEDNISLNNPRKEGYTFDGWYNNPEFNGEKVENISLGTTGNIKLYAKYTPVEYNIIYQLDNGTNNDLNPNTYNILNEIKLENPRKEGYTFKGWELNGSIVENIPLGSTGNIILVAKWKINKYTITFDTDGGSDVPSINQDYNTKITEPKEPTKDGFIFVGWDKELPTTMPAENITLKALWVVGEYAIRFDTNGGTKINPIVQDYNTKIIKPVNPTKEGYTFIGWDQEIPETMPSNNLVIKAIWQINTYTITFDLDGGSTNNPTTYTVEDKVILINPTKEGYTFVGWTSDTISEPIINVVFENEVGNKHFVANYVQVIFTVRFDSNGGTNIESIEYSIESDEVILPIPTKERYNFLGWYDFEDNKIEKIEKSTLKDLELVAKWERKVTDGLEFYLNTDKTYYILTGLGKVKDNDIVIPDTYNGLPVKSIGQRVFYQYTNLTYIEIPASVTYIGTAAFFGCTNLEKVYYNGTIEDWCNFSFNGMYSNPIYYAKNCYVLNEKQEYYEVTDENNSIDLKIPETVTSISTYHFYKMVAIKSVVLGDNVISIGSYSFSYCTNLTNIEIPNSVTSIGAFAFENCTSLTSIEIPNSVTSIESATFYKCSSLVCIKIPNSVTSISLKTFENCTSLTNIEIPNSVTSIGPFAFYNCTSLESVYYNGTIEDWCNISIDSLISNPMYYAKHMYMLNENNEYYEVTDANNEVDLVIPSDVIKIGKSQFYKMSALKSVIIRNSITSIGYSAFEGCTSLTSIIIPNSVTSIESYAFDDCDNLTIYCEAKSQPEDWDSKWNSSNCPVVWGYVDLDIYEENGYKYINLGRYPQTVVTDETIIEALSNISTINELGYIEYNGNEYKKVVAKPLFSDYTFSNGNTIVEGNIYYFIVEPIKWRVLEENDGIYKLLCEMIVDNTEFYYVYEENRTINGQTIYPNNYEYSNIRAWLNGYNGSSYNVEDYTNKGFLDIAFTEGEKFIINNTLIDNSLDSTGYSSNSFICNNTIDKIYLLSRKDAIDNKYGFNSLFYERDISRRAQVSDYSRSKYCSIDIDSAYYGNGLWWLRSPGFNYSSNARIVNKDGSESYNRVDLTCYGVRPAITISINESKDYQVVFKDYNDNPLKLEYVDKGENATSPNDPNRVGYTFKGWDKEYTNIQSDLEVKALYEPITYTVTFDSDSGNDIADLTFTIETQNLMLPTPVKEGYEFLGWYDALDNKIDTIKKGTSENIELTAKWEEIKSLEYELSEDEMYYIVTGIGNVTDTDLTIPSTYKNLPIYEIGSNAFYNCDQITSLVISENIKKIGSSAFYGCFNLLYVELPNSLISIDNLAFSCCTMLIEINIPIYVEQIYNESFSFCNNLSSIVVDENNSTYDSRDNCNAIIETRTNILVCGSSYTNIPNTVNQIGAFAFSGRSYIESIEIPNSVTTIGDFAFTTCYSLVTVGMPNNLEYIDSGAFSYCDSLTNIEIPKTVLSIGDSAFEGCNLILTIVIPKSVYSMGHYVFLTCPNLTIYCEANTQPTSWDDEWNYDNNPVVWGYSEINIYEENGFKYLNLGRYPQTVVTDENTIDALSNIDVENNLGYIEYNGNEYKKVVANPYGWDWGERYNFINGNPIIKNNIYYFLVEPIKWGVLEENDGTYKLLSEMLIDQINFYSSDSETRNVNNKTIYANNYEYSIVRAWLNGYDGSSYNVSDYTNKGFLDVSFTEYEKTLINNTLVDNSLSTTINSSSLYICNNTIDKIYLLSVMDVQNPDYGFSGDESKHNIANKAKVSDYLRSLKCVISTVDSSYGNGTWWLRSPYNYMNGTVQITSTKDYVSFAVTLNTLKCVRPAMTITIK